MSTELENRHMTVDEARRVTERIRIQATNVRDGLEKLQEHVDAAKAGKAWEVLGYKSWTAYLADVMGEEPLRLSRDDRREVVELLAGEGMSIRGIANITGASVGTVHNDQVFNSEHLAGEGMSTQAIAPIVGASHMTIKRDIDSGVSNVTPAASPLASVVSVPGPVAQESTSDKAADGTAKVAVPGSQDGEDHMGASDVGDGHVDPSGISRPAITGLDGKTYTRTWPTPPPEKPRRTPLPKTFTSAVLDIERRLKTLRDLTRDDRWGANKNQVATMHGSDLERINDLLQEVINQVNNSN